ncbi:hypothetical protein T05_12089 [Trichinella murrelli]|uniref:Uncharacterized protein n=1 Tax=Trichinella murrelli TaxID=144512 RepID=A0A0V0U6V9_9BILA|nr:hypothetical protein T05_12089 [Trichinella murrelli]
MQCCAWPIGRKVGRLKAVRVLEHSGKRRERSPPLVERCLNGIRSTRVACAPSD